MSRSSSPRSRFARLLLALSACLGAFVACKTGADTVVHPFESYDVWVTYTSDSALSTVTLEMSLVYQDQAHMLTKDESITCDGVQLTKHPPDSLVFGVVPAKTAGTAYQCVLASQAHTATMTIPVSSPPRLKTPMPAAALSRRADIAISFAPGSSIADVFITAEFPNGQIQELSPRWTASDSVVIDRRDDLQAYPAGPGSLIITSEVDSTIAETGGMHSLKVTYLHNARVPITWT